MSSKKVITFSLWGDKLIYLKGAVINARDALSFYPDFECWFYIHSETVPKETIMELSQFQHVKIIYKTGDLATVKPMMWRFLAIDDPEVEIMMSRDTDTRILQREKVAVDEWLASEFPFHIMRDHPYHHTSILGGMYGVKKIPEIPSWTNLVDSYTQQGYRDYDQTFLQDVIYPIVKDNAMIHATFHHKENERCRHFTVPFDEEYRFVGEYIGDDESRNHHHVSDLKSAYYAYYKS